MPEPGFFAREVPLEGLSPAALEMFGQDGIFSSLGWYRSTIAFALPAGTRAVFVTVSQGGEIRAVFPMQRGPDNVFSALATPYTCAWQPIFAGSAAAELAEIGRVFAKSCGATTVLEALDADAVWLQPLLAGLKAGGLYPLRFDHFGNWHAEVTGLGWEKYLSGRPGALREAIRRRGHKLMGPLGAVFSITDSGNGLEEAIAAYETIYAASWKEPEPFALFNAAFMRACAADGSLRLGILSVDDTALAAQFWVVRDGVAAVLKLAHDEKSRALSPGTVLTGLMIRHMLDNEQVGSLDFGRGDDPYKKDWTGARRQRIGVLLADPRRLRGGAAILRHAAGMVRRRYRGGVSK